MDIPTAKKALKEYFGYDSFRPGQEEIISSVLAGKDVIVLMPTGGGKSVCYQIPAITMKGTCVVISPLIALMKDQVEGLKSNGVRAAYINSTVAAIDQRALENDLVRGKIDLLYVSPEKAVSRDFNALMGAIDLNLIAVDEAHCISEWGHDFRPEYTQLQFLKKQFPRTPVIALTATADRLTRKDIETQLGLVKPEKYISSFDRPNLSLEVRPGRKRLEQIVDFVKNRKGQSGIVYCLSRKSTESVAAKLNHNGIKAAYYHAGLPSSQRAAVQEDFINDNVPVICATIAFGMGIDKSNVRWVIHYNLPKNIEGYYQEIGRAGRDGTKADTLLFYSYADVMTMRNILSENGSNNENVQLSKLERMQQYAESLICRRQILLNYFSENTDGNCGNCDICKNPPQHFDGTVVAQKALSAVYRTRMRVGVNLLIDILRGSKRREVMDNNYHTIKTYGAGAEYSAGDWQQFIQQMLNLGLLEIAYDKKNVLQLTDASEEVLFKGRKVELVRMTSVMERRKQRQSDVPRPKPVRERLRDELFEKLRELRRVLAKKKGIPPYVVFTDASLEEMAAERPSTADEFLQISGVGNKKLQDFGRPFLKAIQEYVVEKSTEGRRVKGSTYLITYQMYQKGLSPEDIAMNRGIHPTTVYSHLAYLFEKGEDVDIKQYVSDFDLEKIALEYNADNKVTPKMIFEKFEGDLEYHIIRLGLSLAKGR